MAETEQVLTARAEWDMLKTKSRNLAALTFSLAVTSSTLVVATFNEFAAELNVEISSREKLYGWIGITFFLWVMYLVTFWRAMMADPVKLAITVDDGNGGSEHREIPLYRGESLEETIRLPHKPK